MSMPYHMNFPSYQNAMGGAQLHTPPSIFEHMVGQQNQQIMGFGMSQIPQLTFPPSISNLSNVAYFTGDKLPRNNGPIIHQKRKLDNIDSLEMSQSKQFITEEKMAAHFRDMHISPNYQTQNPSPSTSTVSDTLYQDTEVRDLEMDGTSPIQSESVMKEQPKLVISEELKRLQQEPILPSCLLSKLERPSMALVLWEPPSKHLRFFPTPRDTPTPIPKVSEDNNNRNNNNNNNSSSSNNMNMNNNNNEEMPDLNQHSTSMAIMEPMDL